MPHGGLSDDLVEELYATLNVHVQDARSRKYINIIGGDFNAEVGCHQPGDDEDVIGDH